LGMFNSFPRNIGGEHRQRFRRRLSGEPDQPYGDRTLLRGKNGTSQAVTSGFTRRYPTAKTPKG
jgi:hypothetical protein